MISANLQCISRCKLSLFPFLPFRYIGIYHPDVCRDSTQMRWNFICRIVCCLVVGDLVIVEVNTFSSTLLEALLDCRLKLLLVTEHEHRDHWTSRSAHGKGTSTEYELSFSFFPLTKGVYLNVSDSKVYKVIFVKDFCHRSQTG